ncbi:M23 family metallopeptidase [Rhodococcus artemisiae]|uniref:M23 family metallopeptidase n=1 Tax=Rhodococcus artemisiae TaxID=714159 RepID=A0ABU7L5W0_9NOCA|nr:M23 family metallopeptidase [Rhodococcus artemisiae]MEE2056927.1 M23 family metallopeptidase [Rhodococcus artemisiae]
MSVVLVTGAVTAAGTTAANATDTTAAGKSARTQAGLSWTGSSEALSTAPQVLSIPGVDASSYTEKLRKATEREQQRIAEAAAAHQAELDRIAHEAAEQAAREEAARRPASVFPAAGIFTSGYGARWGTNHNGIDIAGPIGTPILAVTNGHVIETGPASGFGLWVRVQQDDGTVGVYGHIDRSLVSVGQAVSAGDQIATMGNRGQSTGPHLHYEVHLADGTKIDPAPWLANRGIPIPGTHLS